MTQPTITYGHGYLDDFANFYKGGVTGVADAGCTVTTTVDDVRNEADDYWNGYYIKFTSGNNVGLERLITDWEDHPDHKFTHAAFPYAAATNDTFILSGWKEHETGTTGTFSTLYGDIFDLSVSAGVAGTYYIENDAATSIGLLTTAYPYILFRYKTSNILIKAKIEVMFTAGSQIVLDETSSLTWKTGVVALSPGVEKTVDYIKLYANQLTGNVYYDFALIYQGTFTFPDFKVLQPIFERKIAEIPIFMRDGDTLQSLGLKSPTLLMKGDMQHGENWGTTAYPYGEYLIYNMRDDPWQWFTSDKINCKLLPTYFGPEQSAASGQQCDWEFRGKMHSLADLGESIFSGLQWIGK